MFASATLTLILSAATAMATSHNQQRGHHAGVAKRRDTSPLEARDSFTNKEMTWYGTGTGADACSGKDHSDNDWFVAMGYDQFGDGGCCGKKLRIDYKGKSAVALCVDECASCPQYGQIDLTKGLFKYLTGDLDIGEFFGSWSYVDSDTPLGPTDGDSGSDDDDDDDDDDSSTKKKTSTHHTTSTQHHAAVTTHKSTKTSTHHSSSTHTSSKHSSSAKPSSSKASSSSSEASSSSTADVSEPTEGVANAGSSAGGPSSDTSSSDSDGSDDTGSISGALTGTGAAASVGVNGLFVAGAAIFVAALAL